MACCCCILLCDRRVIRICATTKRVHKNSFSNTQHKTHIAFEYMEFKVELQRFSKQPKAPLKRTSGDDDDDDNDKT